MNAEVTLTGELQLRWHGADAVHGDTRGIDTTQTRLDFGLGYAFSKRTTLQMTTRADISGDGGAEVSLTALYKFGKLPDKLKALRKPAEPAGDGNDSPET
ncbi:MAG: hypothetical protein ACFCUG_10255 [Thiotrichales bacterium]